MHRVIELTIPGASPADVLAELASLDRYPRWMRLVHRVEELAPDDGRPAWRVELRGRVGPFARSKLLRMVRTRHEPDHAVRFERVERDGRQHAAWILDAAVTPAAGGVALRVALTYTGALWGSAVLQRVFEDEVRRGEEALRRLVSAEPTR
jgi:hypothetical protein